MSSQEDRLRELVGAFEDILVGGGGPLNDDDAETTEVYIKFMGRMHEAAQVFLKKQRSYSPGNIADAGCAGVIIRANDKRERLRRIYLQGKDRVEFTDEKIDDTWIDWAVYGIIGLMCEKGDWPGVEEGGVSK